MRNALVGKKMMKASVVSRLLSALDYAIFRREAEAFTLLAPPPGWLKNLWTQAEVGQSVDLSAHFLYLQAFLEEAEAFWAMPRQEYLRSEIWAEEDADGFEWLLEAVAFKEDGEELLLLKLATAGQQSMRQVLQESRELSLEYYQLCQAFNHREVMLHCVVHDLTTPLAGVKSSFSLLNDDTLSKDEVQELIDLGMRQVEKTRRLVQEVLEAFAAKVPTKSEGQPNAYQTATEAMEMLKPIAALRNVQLKIEAPPEGHWLVKGDAHRLERIWFNLIDNALRYAPAGTSVTLRLQDEGTNVRCSVEDEGVGVPDAVVPHLFRKFMQGPNQVGKAGLGLYYCRITVESWGGTITYEPREGGGACFIFSLPRAEVVAE